MIQNFTYINTTSFISHMLFEYFDEHVPDLRDNFELLLSKCVPAQTLLSKYVMNTSFNIVNDNNEPLSFITIAQALRVLSEDEDFDLLNPDDMLLTYCIILARMTVRNFGFALIISSSLIWNLDEAFDNNKNDLFYMLRNIYRDPQIVKYHVHDKRKTVRRILEYLLPKYLVCFLEQDIYKKLLHSNIRNFSKDTSPVINPVFTIVDNEADKKCSL